MSLRLTPLFAATVLLGCTELAHSGASNPAKSATPAVIVAATSSAASSAANAPAIPVAASAQAAAGAAKAIEDQEPAVTAQLRELLQKIADGSIGEDYFTGRAIASLFPDQMKSHTERLRALGGLSGLELLSRTVDGENRVYRYRVLGPNGKLLMEVVYGKSARINQFALATE